MSVVTRVRTLVLSVMAWSENELSQTHTCSLAGGAGVGA